MPCSTQSGSKYTSPTEINRKNRSIKMPLWGNIDTANGFNKPLFANTTNTWSKSTIHGNGYTANTNAYYGVMFGVSTTEKNASTEGAKVVHPGWVSQKIGTGPVVSVSWTGGKGYNSGGYIILSDASVLGTGNNTTNISFTIANSENTLQSYSTNAHWNVINSISVTNGGFGWSDNGNVTYQYGGLEDGNPIANATFTFNFGGRAGRKTYETIVAMGSITGDDPRDNATFVGI